MPGRLTSSHFVGRLGELAELELRFREAAAGTPRLLLLGGDSGIGKTRLVAEFEARAEGALVLRGESVELGEGELPYAPLLGALRPLVRARDEALARLTPSSRGLLATLLPALGESTAGGPADEPAGQVRLFEALLELFDLLTAQRPLVLILEDVHWADRSTRGFIAFLARSLRTEPILLVLTYRSDELHRRHPLRPLLAELDRLDCTRRIGLAAFDRAELSEVLTDILGEPPDRDLLDRLFARSEGNPLYTEELLAAGLDGRGSAPQSLRDAFVLRIERLSPPAQRITRAVAVGVRVDQPTLAAVAGIVDRELTDALRNAVAEQVLVTGADDRFGFRHALLREALYDDLLPGERGELHLALARTLERGCGTEPEAEVERITAVAMHYAAAGEQAEALRATVLAARSAQRVHAWGEVADLAERALELWPRVPEAASGLEIDHVGLLSLAARAHGLASDRTRGELLLRRALDEVDPDADPRRHGWILYRLARLLWHLNRGGDALRTLERAQEVLEVAHARGEGEAERAAVLSWLARTRLLRGKRREAVVDSEVALAAAVAIGDRRTEGEALNTLGMARITLGEVDGGEADLRRAIDLALEADDRDDAATAYGNLADLLNLAGRTREAYEVALEGFAAVPVRLGRARAWMQLTVAALAFDVGEWEVARDHTAIPPVQMLGTLQIFTAITVAELGLAEGRHDDAAAALDEAEPLVRASEEAQWHGAFGALRAELRRREGDLASARQAVQGALDELELCTDDVMRIARVTAAGLAVEADWALRARDLREAGPRRDALARAKIHIDRLRAAASDGGAVEAAWALVGEAELARARGKSDPKRWDRAAAAWDALERPYTAATCRWRGAEALVEAGDRAAAGVVAGEALGVADRLGAGWLAGELRALIARARLAESAPTTSGSASAGLAGPAETDPFGLTPRERQVLALIAAGATNRQIGASLYMAEKTASVHVSRILAKLGVSSRTQAAAVAHRLHLTVTEK